MDNVVNGNNNKDNEKNDDTSLTDSDSSYVIEEEIVEYEISDEDEEVSMNTKKSSKGSQKQRSDKSIKSHQSSFYETALKMKEEELKEEQANKENKFNNNNEIPQPKALKTLRDEYKDSNVSNSFKNVSDSMENIKTRLSNINLEEDSYNKININKTDKEFERDIKRMRFIVSRINETHNNLKKALYNMKGNPFSIPDNESYNDLPSECDTETVADVNVDFCEDDMFNVDEAEIFEKYIMCVDDELKDTFADHYENLYNVNELFKKAIFLSQNQNSVVSSEGNGIGQEIPA
ncbi:hypothetical protein H8356DRAFT_1023556 [Neocallimastix lanati (nom. inval.)]|jgi:hypothetical protein|uniref:Uncharacterized protein n=1 Tax=Neocallimastix californiae TaxID=1754190 RepID=A0A1Y2ACK0_9FUNG|nr:hypothetical protein H8356DRAFT_1023556 [Neocallimastix sp. JGI-2020a]ORY20289.1 hypothetical protein LY90DRAFT_676843 [Neocallimastix californiae]|eukprot:ORY20289.1 hypothetical protein LY90DRAFT_676843 [Neocallimastix californiae]